MLDMVSVEVHKDDGPFGNIISAVETKSVALNDLVGDVVPLLGFAVIDF